MFGSQMRLRENGNMGKYRKLEIAFVVANAEVGGEWAQLSKDYIDVQDRN